MPPSLEVERDLLRSCTRLGCMDEVGRGALAGPVTVGLVVIDAMVEAPPEGIRDSKLLAPARREQFVDPIRAWCRAWSVGHASNDEVDAVGIVGALRLAGLRALAQSDIAPEVVLLDGSHDWLTRTDTLFDDGQELHTPRVVTRVKADRDCIGVAAASILAKVERDAIMVAASTEHPAFGWAENKGYASASHQEALRSLGPTSLHRVSWNIHSDGMCDR